jgi:hypothetical protein
MKLIRFPQINTVLGAKQPEYNPLPCWRSKERNGLIVCCWKFTLWERIYILFTGKIWHQILTFQKPLQPQLLRVENPFETGDVPAE